MTAPTPDPDGATFQILRALPVGIAVFDGGQRAILVNDAYCEGVGLPPGSVQPGTTLDTLTRRDAARGVFGPGDPDAQARLMLAADRSRPARLRRRRFQGRVFDLFSAPLDVSPSLPAGGHVVTVLEVTPLVQQRDDAHAALWQVRDALTTLGFGVSVFAADGVLALSNPAFAALLGLDASQVVAGMTLQDVLARVAGADVFADGGDGAFLSFLRLHDRRDSCVERRVRNDRRVLDVTYGPLPGGGFTLTVADVTSLVRAEDEARRRAELVTGILYALPVGVNVFDAGERLTLRNEAYQDIFGDDAMPMGISLTDILTRRLQTGEIDEAYVARLRAQSPNRRHDVRLRPNGTRLDIRTAPLPDGGFVAVFADVTAQAVAEQAARERTATLDVALRHIRHGILLWDAEHRLIAFNAAAVRLLGNHPDVVCPGARIGPMLDALFQRGEFGQGEAAALWRERLRSQDRATGTVYQRVTPMGRVLEVRYDPTPGAGFVVTLTDITDIREAEAATLRAKEAAEAANRAKSKFLASMGHELRTPLNAIIGFAETLTQSDPVHAREYAAEIQASGQRLLDVINVILGVSRLEAGGIELADDLVDLGLLAQSAARQAEGAARATGVRIAVSTPPVPPIRGDARRLQEAVGALLRVAVDSSRPGEAVGLATAVNTAGRPVMTISDCGTPIEPADMPGLFDLLGRLDRPAGERAARMGLALYAARALLQAHGGDLLLKSDKVMGTSVALWLPRARLAAAEPSDRVPAPRVTD